MNPVTKNYKLGEVSLHDCGGHRLSSRSVSWNCTGSYLGVASSDRNTRLYNLDGSGGPREVLVVSQHTAPVQRVRFHPNQDTLLCTAASDSSVRLFDIRSATQKNLGRIDIQGTVAADVAWCPAPFSPLLAITESNGSIHICDTRKISVNAAASTTARPGHNSSTSATVHSFSLEPSVVEACIFSPGSEHLVAATTSNGMGEISIWNWAKDKEAGKTKVPAHCGPIYSIAFSPDGQRFATGGSDSVVGIWDSESVCCTHTVSRNTKFTRSVAFSHDSQFLASSTEDDGIDLALASTGELVGKVQLGRRHGQGGADEIAFHPRQNILACARCNSSVAVTVAKLSITNQ